MDELTEMVCAELERELNETVDALEVDDTFTPTARQRLIEVRLMRSLLACSTIHAPPPLAQPRSSEEVSMTIT